MKKARHNVMTGRVELPKIKTKDKAQAWDIVEEHRARSTISIRATGWGGPRKQAWGSSFKKKVNRFRMVFSSSGVSASPDKINNMARAGRPDTVEEVRSLLQACSFNTKFTLDHGEGRSYNEITAASGRCWKRRKTSYLYLQYCQILLVSALLTVLTCICITVRFYLHQQYCQFALVSAVLAVLTCICRTGSSYLYLRYWQLLLVSTVLAVLTCMCRIVISYFYMQYCQFLLVYAVLSVFTCICSSVSFDLYLQYCQYCLICIWSKVSSYLYLQYCQFLLVSVVIPAFPCVCNNDSSYLHLQFCQFLLVYAVLAILICICSTASSYLFL